jgi:hypothetical protein
MSISRNTNVSIGVSEEECNSPYEASNSIKSFIHDENNIEIALELQHHQQEMIPASKQTLKCK